MKRTHEKIVEEIRQHLIDYGFFASVAFFAIALLLKFQGNRIYQIYILGTFAITYILWGIFHHKKEKTLHNKVVLEYLLIAGCIIVSVLLLL